MRILNIMIGPPKNKIDDQNAVKRFLDASGEHFVCGGTTASIVAKFAEKDINFPLDAFSDADIIPSGKIGNDIFVTEGIITLIGVLNALQSKCPPKAHSGEYTLYSMLLTSDTINIFLGKAINPAHTETINFNKKFNTVNGIKSELQRLGKTVNIISEV